MNLLRPIDRTLSVMGLNLHLLDWGGEGRTPLLLLHGFTGHAHAWDTLSLALQPHFHVYALDQRGHGDSDLADAYHPALAFQDLSGVLAELERGGRDRAGAASSWCSGYQLHKPCGEEGRAGRHPERCKPR